MPRSIHAKVLLVVMLVAAAGCKSNTLSNQTSPTTTTTTDFSGTINTNGAATNTFTAFPGAAIATLTSLSPNVAVGFSMGTWTGTACQTVLANDAATQGAILNGSVSAAGTLCVRVYDVGNVTEPTSFAVSVVHY